MAKRTKMPTDLNQRAKAIVDLATSDEEVSEKKDERDLSRHLAANGG